MKRKILSSKNEIIRTDILTRKKYNRNNLHRIVFLKTENRLVWDEKQIMFGRSVYFLKDWHTIDILFNKEVLIKKLKSNNMFIKEDYELIKQEFIKKGEINGEKTNKTND